MPSSVMYSLAIIVIVAIVTLFTRMFPFLFFGKSGETPSYILYLGSILPSAIMAMLIVYCLRKVNVMGYSFGIPEFASVAVVVALHVWKRNNLVSILGGTTLYMALVQFLFI